MQFCKRKGRLFQRGATASDAGQVQKTRRTIKRSPPVAMEVKLLAIEALDAGLSADEVGELVGVGVSTIHKWHRDHAEGGVRVRSNAGVVPSGDSGRSGTGGGQAPVGG